MFPPPPRTGESTQTPVFPTVVDREVTPAFLVRNFALEHGLNFEVLRGEVMKAFADVWRTGISLAEFTVQFLATYRIPQTEKSRDVYSVEQMIGEMYESVKPLQEMFPRFDFSGLLQKAYTLAFSDKTLEEARTLINEYVGVAIENMLRMDEDMLSQELAKEVYAYENNSAASTEKSACEVCGHVATPAEKKKRKRVRRKKSAPKCIGFELEEFEIPEAIARSSTDNDVRKNTIVEPLVPKRPKLPFRLVQDIRKAYIEPERTASEQILMPDDDFDAIDFGNMFSTRDDILSDDYFRSHVTSFDPFVEEPSGVAERVITTDAARGSVSGPSRQTASWHRQQALLSPQLQSSRKLGSKRDERDVQQRVAAQERAHIAHISKPKLQREAEIYAQRDKRNPILAEADLQSGALPIAAGVAIGLAIHKISSLFRKADKLIEGASELVKAMRAFVDLLKKHFNKVLWVVPMILFMHFIYEKFNIKVNPLNAVFIATISSIVGAEVWSHASKFFPGGGVEQQSGILDAAPKLLAAMLAFSVFRGKTSPATVTEFMKRISMFDRVSMGWDSFLKWVFENIENVINWVRVKCGKDKIELFKNIKRPALEWASEVDKLCTKDLTESMPGVEKTDEILRLIQIGAGLKEAYRGTPVEKYVAEYNSRLANIMLPYQGALNARNNFRAEPAVFMVYANPGVGKTLMAMPMCSAIMLLSGLLPPGSDFETVTKNIWQKGSSEFWNSYAGQICMVTDDAFQARANANDKDNEYINLIHAVGSWSFPLNFADLASKGKIYFSSKFIFGTTNLASVDSEAKMVIQDSEAIVRRLTFPYKISVKPAYRLDNGRLDFAKFQTELARSSVNCRGLDAYPWHIWEAQRHDFGTGVTDACVLPLRDVIIEVAADLKRRKETFETTKDSLQNFVAGFTDFSPTPSSFVDVDLSSEAELQCDMQPLRGSLRKICVEKTMSMSDAIHDFFGSDVWYKKSMVRMARNFIAIYGAFKISQYILLPIFNAMWRFWSDIFHKGKEVIPYGPRVQSNRPLTGTRRVPVRDARLQAGDSSVANNVYANTYKMFLITPCDGELIVGQICFVMDTMAVQPEHFTKAIRQHLTDGEVVADSEVVLRSAINSQNVISMTVRHYLSLKRYSKPSEDVEFVQFENIRAHRNITGSFIREGDLKFMSGIQARLDVCELDDKKNILAYNRRMVYTFSKIAFGTNLRASGRVISRYFQYQAPTSAGDCGAPLCVMDNSGYSGRTAIGLHIAGDGHRKLGYSSIVTQELVAEAVKAMQVIEDCFEADLADRGVEFQSGTELPFEKKGSFMAIGTVSKPVTICPKTRYETTELYGCFGDYEYLPAPLDCVFRDGVMVYPMENAVAPYSTAVLTFEQPWLDTAMHVAMRPFNEITSSLPRNILTFEEAVKGIVPWKLRSIPRGTAAGFPYIYDVRDGKKEFFGTGQDYDITNDRAIELELRVSYILQSARSNKRLSHVFVDFLKDELRSKAKVDAVATRLISSAPLDYTIAVRMMFGAFSSALMRNHTVCGMAPGICVFTEWHVLADQLQKKGDKCFDGDFKAFDSSEQPQIHDLILKVINAWYADGEENARIRRVLWLDLVHSRHIGGLGKDQRYIYQWAKSLPSGHPLTTIVNSIYSLFCMVSAYISLTGDLVGFWEHVSTVTYGDDNNNNVDDYTVDAFNQLTVAQALQKEFKMIYTPGNKTGAFEPYVGLEDTTFLKRRFRLVNEGALCPLELDSFLYTCYFCKNKKLKEQILWDTLENALEELSMHEQAVWDTYAPRIADILVSMGHVTKAPLERAQYLRVVQSRSDNWY